MEKRWRNLGIIAAVLVVLIIIIFLVFLAPKEITFADGYNYLNLLIEEYGVPVDDFQAIKLVYIEDINSVAVEQLSYGEMELLKIAFQDYKDSLSDYKKTRDLGKLNRFVDMYIGIVEVSQKKSLLYNEIAELREDPTQGKDCERDLSILADFYNKQAGIFLDIADLVLDDQGFYYDYEEQEGFFLEPDLEKESFLVNLFDTQWSYLNEICEVEE